MLKLKLQYFGEKDPRPGPLFEGNPVGEGTTRRGTATPVHRPQRPACFSFALILAQQPDRSPAYLKPRESPAVLRIKSKLPTLKPI